jgi:hypothetical protein
MIHGPAIGGGIVGSLAVRILTGIVGLLAIGWGALALPIFVRQAPIERIAQRILSDEQFKFDELTARTAELDAIEQTPLCRPDGLRAAAVIRTRIAEAAFGEGKQTAIDGLLSSEVAAIRQSLACAPADPFLWLALFAAENTQRGLRPEHFEYLRLSYRLGPNEAWIAMKRNHLALVLFEQLPPDLAEAAVSEFVRLVKSGLIEQAANILTGPGWRLRGTLLPRLSEVDFPQRRALAKAISARGLDAEVPGIAPEQKRGT